MPFYKILVVIHILSAILGLGPGFMLIQLVKKPKSLSELKNGFKSRKKIHIFVMIGGVLLLFTGLTMGFINPVWFKNFWYVSSLVLFIIALCIGPILLSPRSKKIKKLLKEHDGNEIPDAYWPLAKSLFFWERVENAIFLIIIILMILKPYNFETLLEMFYLK